MWVRRLLQNYHLRYVRASGTFELKCTLFHINYIAQSAAKGAESLVTGTFNVLQIIFLDLRLGKFFSFHMSDIRLLIIWEPQQQSHIRYISIAYRSYRSQCFVYFPRM